MAARPTRPAADDEPAVARLAALTESLSEVLGAAAPLDDLVARVALTTRATVALLGSDGALVRSSGTLPLALVTRELPAAGASSPHRFEAEGWCGAVHPVTQVDDGVNAARWLVAVSRRPDFPTAMDRAALGIGGGLVAAIGRAAATEARQGRAARAGILERALEPPPRRDDPELAARCADLGIDVGEGARVIVVALARHAGRPGARGPSTSVAIGDALDAALGARGVVALVSPRAEHVVALAQGSGEELRHACATAGLPEHGHIGIGRSVTSVGAVVDSYHDAHLGALVVRRQGRGRSIVSYEEFDFATRLFADVGLDTMASWATDYLAPLGGRGPVLAGLATYFAANQNVKVAARELGIHQNSMRYRLAKAEELLGADLSDPAAVASIHLALTALDLADPTAASQRAPLPRRGGTAMHDADSPEAATGFDRPGPTSFGVTFDPSP